MPMLPENINSAERGGLIARAITFADLRWQGVLVRWEKWCSPSSSRIPARWVQEPALRPDEEVCLFVAYAPDGELLEHSLVHARAWADAGFRVVIVAVTNRLEDWDSSRKPPFIAGLLVRENRGYDFGAWAAAINGLLPQLRAAKLVVMVNDSVYGPLAGFDAMLKRARSLDADVIGSVESMQVRRHFQSFLIFFKPSAVRSRAFVQFWRRVRTIPKDLVIREYELKLCRDLERGGLRCTPLFPWQSGDPLNPSVMGWRTLLRRGFPFLKVQVLRENPFDEDLTGWEHDLSSRGYDPQIVRRHLGNALSGRPNSDGIGRTASRIGNDDVRP